MNILITGSNGFIGKNLVDQLKNKYSITEINKKNINLLNSKDVDNFFLINNKYFDLVIHTAVEGGRRTKTDDSIIVNNNLLMLYNLLNNQQYYKKIITLGSGAELDRRFDINQDSVNRYPIDPYGLSKSVINKICQTENKLHNLRIYNCFGINEKEDRMIKNNINRYINHKNIIIHKDKKMDFFYIDDLVKLIIYFIDNDNMPKIFDCCYKNKTKLTDIANIINHLDIHKVKVIIEDPIEHDKDYCGVFTETSINFTGLKKAISIVYNKYKQEN